MSSEKKSSFDPVDEKELEIKDGPQQVWVRVQDAVELIVRENPKRHDIGALMESISRHGYQEVAKYDATIGGIKAGNGRIEALALMEREGKLVPRGIAVEKETGAWAVPITIGVDAVSRSEGFAYLVDSNNLVLSGGDFDGFDMARMWDAHYVDLLSGMDNLPVSVDVETFGILCSMDHMNDFEVEEVEDEEVDDLYTRKVEVPIYEPSGDKPFISDLFDDTRTQALIQDIQKAEGLTEEEKDFLILAAQRHTVLNFSKIADFYAHSGKQVQVLMEDSALVIIDFDRAIELGFVQLTKNMADLVKEEYGE